MEKRKSLLILSLLFSSLSLSSCDGGFFPSFYYSSSSYHGSAGYVSHSCALTDNAYYEPSLSSFQSMSLRDHPEYGTLGEGNMPSLGTTKLLVIPVYFSGTFDSKPTEGDIETIEKAFFGSKEDTGWESLKSYYATSSYGKLDIEGVVTEAYEFPYSSSTFQWNYEKETMDTDYVLKAAVNWAKSQGYIDSSFDANEDGFLDGVDLIYFTNKTYEDNSDLWWAYTTNCSSNAESGDHSSPVPYRYFWAPMSMISNGYYSPDIDTHTLVHETGHMMGLDDYYSYDKIESRDGTSRSSEAPCGMVDMMDCNVGDHDAYSKMMLGWCAPKVVLGEGTFSITLKSFTKTGDFLLIPSGSWNGTPYDEYLILQYYTPTGLNEKDSGGYKEFSNKAYGHGGTYSTSGLQVFHVDSRVAAYDAKDLGTRFGYTYSNFRYSEDPLTYQKETSENEYTLNFGIAASNSGSSSVNVDKGLAYDIRSEKYTLTYNAENRLITFLPATGTNAFLKTGYESNFGKSEFLFTENGNSTYTNEKLSSCYQNDGLFNNGSLFPYTFSVSEQTDSSIKVTFTHL